MTGPDLDRDAVAAFVVGRLDPRGEAALAEQVAWLVAQTGPMPTAHAEALTQLIHRLGGEDSLLAWLDRFPGRPRLVARLVALTGLLDQYSSRPAVVTALRRLRGRSPYPPDLENYLPAEVDGATLADLGGEIHLLLADDALAEATRVALAAMALLAELAPAAAVHDPDVGELGATAGRIRHAIWQAGAEAPDLGR
jgi:hypothetical protein